MITSFKGKLAEDLFYDRSSRETRKFPAELRRVARRKLLYIYEAENIKDLKVPPGNRLEALKGDLVGFHSIRINQQWRVIFKWTASGASDVEIIDYH